MNTETLIFHHKYVSPYSEKIRLMLGYAGLAWQSLEAPLTPPRPAIDPLVNGYRRIPVAQIGADVFCDTRIISDEIARLSGMPMLSPYTQTDSNWSFAECIENDIFQASLSSVKPLGLLCYLLTNIPLGKLPGYIGDKKHILQHLNPELSAKKLERDQYKAVWDSYLNNLEDRLTDRKFLSGETPHYVDFCAAHMIWYLRKMKDRSIFDKRPCLQSWHDRMLKFGHGYKVDITINNGLVAAKQNDPRPICEKMTKSPLTGTEVTISNTDILLGATSGTLVGENAHRWIIARDTDVAGRVHIHFPKVTYKLAQN